MIAPCSACRSIILQVRWWWCRSIERHLHLISVCPSGHPLKDVNEEITFAAMVPMQVYNTLQVPEERARLCRIRHLIIGGGAIDEALEQKLKALPAMLPSGVPTE